MASVSISLNDGMSPLMIYGVTRIWSVTFAFKREPKTVFDREEPVDRQERRNRATVAHLAEDAIRFGVVQSHVRARELPGNERARVSTRSETSGFRGEDAFRDARTERLVGPLSDESIHTDAIRVVLPTPLPSLLQLRPPPPRPIHRRLPHVPRFARLAPQPEYACGGQKDVRAHLPVSRGTATVRTAKGGERLMRMRETSEVLGTGCDCATSGVDERE